MEKPQTGFYAINFSGTTPDNKQLSLEKAMGKATIIDFWASWCRPCRESANPFYKKLYEQFHANGLNIIGISSDRHEHFWLKAIKQDSVPWQQIIDKNKKILKLYQIKKLPSMFLIDKKGKIIGKNLWGDELKRKIDSLLHL